MSTNLKRVLIGTVIAVAVIFGVLRYLKVQTKQASPEETVTFYLDGPDGVQVEVMYCRPYKKGRAIFGGLVPYNKVWRTGANEATTFTANKDISFGGTRVKAGTYTLWTLPGEKSWTVYLNSKMYNWGVDMDGNAQRDPAFDIAAIQVPVVIEPTIVEQFTISVSDPGKELVLRWDDVMVAIPITF